MNHFRRLVAGALLGLISFASPVAADEAPKVVLLYPADHPANAAAAEPDEGTPEWTTRVAARPSILPFVPPGDGKNRPACIVCPGGGYGGLAVQKEGVEPARWLNERGVVAFVLRYRCGGGKNQQPVPLQDAQRAIRLVRSRADEWGVDVNRVGVWGFSAGGHLAATTGVFGEDGNADAADPLDRLSSRPNFLVLIYPVISMQQGTTHGGSRQNLLGKNPSDELAAHWSADQQVSDKTPPTFLVHATDDGGVPVKNSLLFYSALVRHKVPAEMHIFERGGHGFGMYRGDRPADLWPNLLDPWLRGQGMVD
ncbi:MAG: alpha/beta hydrolase [Planctomycetales bacterium]|nr:alpha/beta hydrolase [Planctomycetales bacterium]